MAGTRSRDKGKRGEREVKDILVSAMQEVENEIGTKGCSSAVKRNSTQSDGGGDDLLGIPLWSVEVKFQEKLNLGAWWKQAVEQNTDSLKSPCVIYRQSRRPWRVRLEMEMYDEFALADITIDDFLRIFKASYKWYLRRMER